MYLKKKKNKSILKNKCTSFFNSYVFRNKQNGFQMAICVLEWAVEFTQFSLTFAISFALLRNSL